MQIARTRLYDLADELYRLAPWSWMNETQLIGLRHPDTGELAHISIMGASGNHFSLALYLGTESLHRFNLIQESEYEGIELAPEDTVALILESRQLQASFDVRDELLSSELREIKSLGRRYRGNNWPNFRSFHPGWAPQAIESEEETAWLTFAIEQTLAVAPTLRADRFGDYRSREGGGVEHIARERGPDGAWRTFWTPCDRTLFELPRPDPGEFFVAQVAALPRSKVAVECQFQLLPHPVGARGKGTFPYIACTVEAASGKVLGMELLNVESRTFDDLIRSVPDLFLQQWAGQRLRPSSIQVATAATYAMLEKPAAALGIPLQRTTQLPGLDDLMYSIQMVMQGEMG